MGRKGRGKGGGRGGRSRQGFKSGALPARATGIEKYGQDKAEEFLALDDQSEEAEMDEEEEDVMALKPLHAEESSKKKAKKGKEAKSSKLSDESDADLEPVSKGWGRHDFYGGEDAGDDSEAASDEERTFKEAKKMEEQRALRLQDVSDPLAALLGAEELSASSVGAPSGMEKSLLDAEAQFESMFVEEAETTKVERDLSQLSEAKRRVKGM